MKKIAASFNQVWLETLQSLVSSGEVVEVRGTESLELLGDYVEFNMGYPILTVAGRSISYDFMFAEAWWILTGRNRAEHLLESAPSYKKFSDDGIRLNGAYGPKVVDQVSYVVETLRQDPRSRQAVINIWRERPGPSKDIPCTISVQFMIRGNYLDCFVNMRSNDAWLGMPYDVFAMTMLAMQVGLELSYHTGNSYQIGTMHHYAASRHLYIKDLEKAKSVLNQDWNRKNHGNASIHPPESARVTMIKLHQNLEHPDDFLRGLGHRANKNYEKFDEETSELIPWMTYGIPNASKKLLP